MYTHYTRRVSCAEKKPCFSYRFTIQAQPKRQSYAHGVLRIWLSPYVREYKKGAPLVPQVCGLINDSNHC